MSCCQRRIAPLNLGLIGMLSAFVNGFNLIISHIIVPDLHFNLKYFLFPFFYFCLSFVGHFVTFGPFVLFNLFFSLFLFVFVSNFNFIFILLSAFSGCSKFCILGCVRMISQLISFELIFSLLIYFLVWSFFYLNNLIFLYLL